MADSVNAETVTVGGKIAAASAAGALWAVFMLPIALIGAVSSMIGIPLFSRGKKIIQERIQPTTNHPSGRGASKGKLTRAEKRRLEFEEQEHERQLFEQLEELQKKKNRKKSSAARASA